ncbi:MAG: KpsF/GutQ family sugar-phosphate isomerase [Rickettsiales bacterium]|nr:MAG: KpsF/GutQ family sugar-phosphate isomerase [Rickettsiales bacterium]
MNYSSTAKLNIKEQSTALMVLAENIPNDFSLLIEYILCLKGRVVLVGMGKSGYIAKKIAASLSSTGTPSLYIHPGEASHGDLGMITKDDIVIMISNSGETRELCDTINYCKKLDIKIVAITMNEDSTLAKNSDFLLKLPQSKETSSIAAPTTSALMTLSLGDALVTVLHEARGFTADDFKLFHPGGKIGVNLLKVADLMHKNDEVPIVRHDTKFTDVIVTITTKRLGCALVIDKNDELIGIITDGDLRRHIHEDLTKKLAHNVMSEKPEHIRPEKLAIEALVIMNKKLITILPVIEHNKIIGIIHIHDLLKAGIG